MNKILEKRIVPVINPTQNQKSVLAKITAAATPKTAAADISKTRNLSAARDMLEKMGFITLDEEGAQLTDEGTQVMIDQDLADESGELTETGKKAAFGDDPEGNAEDDMAMESFGMIKVLREDARREKWQKVPSDLLDKLTPEEQTQLFDVLDQKSEFHDDENEKMWYKVYDFYSTEMPYGTAKARTGDPDQWVLDELT